MAEIREMKPEDFEFLREMLYEALFIPAGEEKPPAAIVDEPHLAKYIKDFGRPGDRAFVLVNENELIGAAWTRLFSEKENSYGFVDEKTPELSMAIREAFRGRGFGTRLIEKICGALKADGIENLSLSVDKQNPAVRLYQRSGFVTVAEAGTAYTMLKKNYKMSVRGK